MIGPRWVGWMLAATLLTVLSMTVLLPLTGEVTSGLAIVALAAFIITL
ncbi:hypothetical protein ACYZTX_28965 [Pseudomonas sp. MDT1-17]